MLNLIGLVHDVIKGEKKDYETGEITPEFSVELLHKKRGKGELVSLKLDSAVVAQGWTKAIGQQVSVEVDYYAIKTREGSVQKGLSLVDKKALPTVMPRSTQAAA